MWRIDPPAVSAEETFLQCISRVRNRELKARLKLITPDVVREAQEFEAAANISMLHNIVPTETVVGVVTRDEMSNVYDRMVDKGSPGRPIYDIIKSAARNDRCPLCGQRVVATLDHHLPKSLYPALAVTPVNLVPSCADCNFAKLDIAPKNGSEVTLHPYFDYVDDEIWLSATVVEGASAAVQFSVTRPSKWNAMLADRVEHHFTTLRLGALYASHAGEELRNIQHQLIALFARAGSETVREHLEESARSRAAVHKNSWQTATYKALATSAWYYKEGVLLAP